MFISFNHLIQLSVWEDFIEFNTMKASNMYLN